MCDKENGKSEREGKTIPVRDAVGTVLVQDITEIRPGEFKGRAFKKGHVIREEDIGHLQRLGKERLYVLNMAEDEMHENDAAYSIASALVGDGVRIEGEPKEGKINIIATRDGLLEVRKEALFAFNMLGDVMCATLHTNSVVREGQIIAGTRAIPLIAKREVVARAVRVAEEAGGIIHVRKIRKPKAGIVITGNEVYYGRIKDAFAPVITRKIEDFGGEVVAIYYAPDDKAFIETCLRELLDAGADLLITTGGMSVDPDDVTRFAIRDIGATNLTYGASVLPGAMVLIGYLERAECGMRNAELKSESEHSELATPNSALIPILGIPACGMFHKTTIFDLVFPRLLAGENIGRRELAELGHGGLCLNCKECRYPVCPFGK